MWEMTPSERQVYPVNEFYGMSYSKRILKEFRGLAKKIKHVEPLEDWDSGVSKCWKRYVKGCDRKELIKGTRFTYFKSLVYHFRQHPSYKEIAKVRKTVFRRVKSLVMKKIEKYPWLLGLYYADGSTHMGTQLSFSLSLHEKVIAERVIKELKEIMSDDAHIACDIIGHMTSVRIHSVELCCVLPKKSDEQSFFKIWRKFTTHQKLEFIGGFTDGDGSCSFEDRIYSIHIYSKIVPYLISYFKQVLGKYGYLSIHPYWIYLSPDIGHVIKPFTMKQYIQKAYAGSVDVDKAFRLLKSGTSLRKMAKIFGKDKKTISIALRRSFDRDLVENLIEKHRKFKNYSMGSEKNPMEFLSVTSYT